MRPALRPGHPQSGEIRLVKFDDNVCDPPGLCRQVRIESRYFYMLANVFDSLKSGVKVGVATDDYCGVVVILVGVGDKIGRQHYVDALLHHYVATLLPDPESHLDIRGVVQRIEEPLLLDAHVRVAVRFLANVVVVNPFQISTVRQLDGELVELKVVPATTLGEHVVQVAPIDEYHHAFVVAGHRIRRRL